MATQVKTFRISNEADEQALNQFLANKIVRHCSAQFTATGDATGGGESGGVWNTFVVAEERNQDQQDRPRGRQEMGGGRRTDGQSERGNGPSNHRDRDGGGRDGGGSRNRDTDRNATASSAPREKRELAPRPDFVPDLPAEDLPLYEAVRRWRNSRAREERVKPYVLFNNKEMETLAKEKPSTPDALKVLLPNLSTEHFDKFHNELLGFLTSQHATAEATAPRQDSEANAQG